MDSGDKRKIRTSTCVLKQLDHVTQIASSPASSKARKSVTESNSGLSPSKKMSNRTAFLLSLCHAVPTHRGDRDDVYDSQLRPAGDQEKQLFSVTNKDFTKVKSFSAPSSLSGLFSRYPPSTETGASPGHRGKNPAPSPSLTQRGEKGISSKSPKNNHRRQYGSLSKVDCKRGKLKSPAGDNSNDCGARERFGSGWDSGMCKHSVSRHEKQVSTNVSDPGHEKSSDEGGKGAQENEGHPVRRVARRLIMDGVEYGRGSPGVCGEVSPLALLGVEMLHDDESVGEEWIPKEPLKGTVSSIMKRKSYDDSEEKSPDSERKRVSFRHPPLSTCLTFSGERPRQGTVFITPHIDSCIVSGKAGESDTHPKKRLCRTSALTFEKSPHDRHPDFIAGTKDSGTRESEMSSTQVSRMLRKVNPAVLKDALFSTDENGRTLIGLEDLWNFLLKEDNVKVLPRQNLEVLQNVVLKITDVNSLSKLMVQAINERNMSPDQLKFLLESIASKLNNKDLLGILCKVGLKLC